MDLGKIHALAFFKVLLSTSRVSMMTIAQFLSYTICQKSPTVESFGPCTDRQTPVSTSLIPWGSTGTQITDAAGIGKCYAAQAQSS